MALEAKLRKIFIAGFTFFKTPYAVGYRDSLRDLDVLNENEKKRGICPRFGICDIFKIFRK